MPETLTQAIHPAGAGLKLLRSSAAAVLKFLGLYHSAGNLRYRLSLALNYVSALGLRRGVTAFLQLEVPQSKSSFIEEVWLRGGRSALLLRAGTADTVVFRQIFVEKQYDLDVPLQPRLIIDGGAHVGCASIFFARKYPAAMILAIEPEDRNFAILKRNVSDYPNVTAIHGALWGYPTLLNVVDPTVDSWSFRVSEGDGASGAKFLGLTIDELLAWSGKPTIDILKLDVEGAEREIFSADCTGWIGKLGTLLIELHDRIVPGCRAALDKAVAGGGFVESASGECVVLQRDPRELLSVSSAL